MPNSQASSSSQQTNPRHKSTAEERLNQQTIPSSQQATPRQKPAADERRKEKTAKKTKSKENKQEHPEDVTQSGVKPRILPTMKTIPWFGTDGEDDNADKARAPPSTLENQELKDSWDDASDNEGRRQEEDPQHHQLQQRTTEGDLPPQQEEKQQDRTTLLTRVAKADKAIMKALIKIATSTGQNEEVATQIDTIISEHSKLKKIIIEQGQEIAFQKGKISELEKTATKNERQGREQETDLQPPVAVEERKSYALVLTSDTMGKREMAELIKRKINPSDVGLPDATMREGRQGIILTTASKESSGKLEKILRARDDFQNLKVNKPKQNRFNIKVVGVDEELANETLPERIIVQNKLTCNPEDIQVKKSWKGRQGITLVLALNKAGLTALKGRKQMNIGWNRCPIFDHISLPRCSRCAQHGHTRFDCQGPIRCTNCGRGGHRQEECQDDPFCRVCEGEGHPGDKDHSMMSWQCPVYQDNIEFEKRKILARLD